MSYHMGHRNFIRVESENGAMTNGDFQYSTRQYKTTKDIRVKVVPWTNYLSLAVHPTSSLFYIIYNSVSIKSLCVTFYPQDSLTFNKKPMGTTCTSLAPAWYQPGTNLIPTWYQLSTSLGHGPGPGALSRGPWAPAHGRPMTSEFRWNFATGISAEFHQLCRDWVGSFVAYLGQKRLAVGSI